MLASMIFRKEPFFHGHDNYDQVISHTHSLSVFFTVSCSLFLSVSLTLSVFTFSAVVSLVRMVTIPTDEVTHSLTPTRYLSLVGEDSQGAGD